MFRYTHNLTNGNPANLEVWILLVGPWHPRRAVDGGVVAVPLGLLYLLLVLPPARIIVLRSWEEDQFSDHIVIAG